MGSSSQHGDSYVFSPMDSTDFCGEHPQFPAYVSHIEYMREKSESEFVSGPPSIDMDGLDWIYQERSRQREKWGDKHDDEHKFGELRAAAIAYLLSPDIGGEGPIDHWPFERESFKPGVGIEPLVKAGAMIAAETDRLLRSQSNNAGQP